MTWTEASCERACAATRVNARPCVRHSLESCRRRHVTGAGHAQHFAGPVAVLTVCSSSRLYPPSLLDPPRRWQLNRRALCFGVLEFWLARPRCSPSTTRDRCSWAQTRWPSGGRCLLALACRYRWCRQVVGTTRRSSACPYLAAPLTRPRPPQVSSKHCRLLRVGCKEVAEQYAGLVRPQRTFVVRMPCPLTVGHAPLAGAGGRPDGAGVHSGQREHERDVRERRPLGSPRAGASTPRRPGHLRQRRRGGAQVRGLSLPALRPGAECAGRRATRRGHGRRRDEPAGWCEARPP